MDSFSWKITRERFDALKHQLVNTHEASVSGDDDGVIVGHGVTADYKYDGTALTVEIAHHPFFISTALIFDEIGRSIQSAPTAPPPAPVAVTPMPPPAPEPQAPAEQPDEPAPPHPETVN